jgi:hypothetical protein
VIVASSEEPEHPIVCSDGVFQSLYCVLCCVVSFMGFHLGVHNLVH